MIRTGVRAPAAAALAVALVGGGAWWATHPDRLQPVGGRIDLQVPVGESAVLGMFAQPVSGRVALERAEPVVTENSSDARLRVLLCQTPAGQDPVGSARGRADRVCARARQPRGTSLAALAERGEHLVLEVRPQRPGTLVVEGLQVGYRAGARAGQQASGLVVTVRTGTTG